MMRPKRRLELKARQNLRQQLLEECGGLCQQCLQRPDWRGLALHHVKHLSRGGKTEVGNCRLLCGRCHSHSHHIREV
ncbi:MAG: HNH endonuclease signature motif containing protein [Dehalococcoidia bacterium]|nr:HNH endonuclease signature motif containing protein [Dehalococcoidia bacterium]